eukprot:2915139-Alexandrium_andersonii.AAC.1
MSRVGCTTGARCAQMMRRPRICWLTRVERTLVVVLPHTCALWRSLVSTREESRPSRVLTAAKWLERTLARVVPITAEPAEA